MTPYKSCKGKESCLVELVIPVYVRAAAYPGVGGRRVLHRDHLNLGP